MLAVEAVENTFGRLDVVISNAGVIEMAHIDSDNLVIFDRTMVTNSLKTYLVEAEAAKRLPEGGRIIAVSTSVLPEGLCALVGLSGHSLPGRSLSASKPLSAVAQLALNPSTSRL